MGRFLTIPAALTLAIAMATGAAAQDTSTTTTTGTADIQERAGIDATGDVIFQDIMTPSVTLGSLTTTSETSANITVGGDAVVSLAVPEMIGVSLPGGEETLMVITSTNGDYTAVGGLESLIAYGGVLSVDVGGSITVSAADLAPGEYRGLLTVVAQYN